MPGSYDAFAPHFDAWQQAFGGPYDALILPRLLAALGRWAPGARRLVDLGIGTGDLVVALARRGFDVVGVDRSAPMLEVARAKVAAAALPRPPRLLEQDLRALAPGAPCDAAICVYTVMNQLTADGDLAAACAAVRDALVAGGVFLFELNLPAAYARWWQGTEMQVLGDVTVTRTHAPVPGTSCVEAEVTIRRGADVRRDHVRQRPFADAEVTAALAAAGLVALGCEGYDPFGDGPASKALWAAQRPRA
ncbi:MAG: class I SAM-dependent methyltransferase [bacterium]|nr:class I SAM-dependent methyltransferase [bacterium]